MVMKVGFGKTNLLRSATVHVAIGPANASMQFSYSCPFMPNQTSTNSAAIFYKPCKLKSLHLLYMNSLQFYTPYKSYEFRLSQDKIQRCKNAIWESGLC